MNTGYICSTGGDVQPSQQLLTVTLLAGTSSVQQSYTINDNSDVYPMELRRFIVEAVIQDSTLADFMVGNDPDNLQDRDSAIFTIRDDDGELLRGQHHNCVFVLPVKVLSFMFSLKFGW